MGKQDRFYVRTICWTLDHVSSRASSFLDNRISTFFFGSPSKKSGQVALHSDAGMLAFQYWDGVGVEGVLASGVV